MAKKKNFDDPLADIDPIMEEAFSVSDEEVQKPKQRRGRPKKKAKDVLVDGDVDASLADELSEDKKNDVAEVGSSSLDVEFPSMDVAAFDVPANDPQEELSQGPVVPDPIISPVQFPDIDMEQSDEKINSGIFSNIPVDVSVELGRSHVSLKEVFELTEGSIIELERLVGEPLDLVVNGQIVAQGEVVAIDNNYGLRVTTVTSSVKK